MPRVFCFVIVGSFGEFVLDLERGVLGTGDFDFLDDFFQNEILLLRTKKLYIYHYLYVYSHHYIKQQQNPSF